VFFFKTTKHVVRCSQDVQSTTELRCDIIDMEYAQDKYCNMLLTLGNCNIRAGSNAR
jgi:hypothetical protein